MEVMRTSVDSVLPIRMTNDSVGYDLFTPHDFVIPPGKWETIDTGLIFISNTKIFYSDNTGYMIYPELCDKSSVSTKKNCIVKGKIIDPGYRGYIKVILHNLDYENPIKFLKGDPIAQVVFRKAFLPEIRETDENIENLTERKKRGFGEVTENYLSSKNKKE